jgi:hypothetical protein
VSQEPGIRTVRHWRLPSLWYLGEARFDRRLHLHAEPPLKGQSWLLAVLLGDRRQIFLISIGVYRMLTTSEMTLRALWRVTLLLLLLTRLARLSGQRTEGVSWSGGGGRVPVRQ